MRLIVMGLGAALAAAGPSYAADQVATGPVPAWVSPLPVPAAAAASGATKSSTEALLFEREFRFAGQTESIFVHYAIRLNDPQALSAGNIELNWDPALEKITVHSAVLHRGAKTIDLLAAGPKFTILRRETNLAEQSLDGRLTATLQSEGVEVGDTIEVSFTIDRTDPTMQGHVEESIKLLDPGAATRAHIRVIVPADRAIRLRELGTLPAPKVATSGHERSYDWDLQPFKTEKPPEYAPARFKPALGFEISDFSGWDSVASLMMPLYRQAEIIPATSPLNAEIEKIRAASADPATRTLAALRLVQNQVRYVNIALGTGGLVPAPADQTWARRYGDCKGKTVLLLALLGRLGIEAEPVLANADGDDGMAERIPMAGVFNHVLVRARVAGRTYWLDGTRTGDDRLDLLTTPDYGWGLPIADKSALVAMLPEPLKQPSYEFLVTTDARAGAGGPVPTTVEIVDRGDGGIGDQIAINDLDPAQRDAQIKKTIEDKMDRFVADKVSSSYDPSTHSFRFRGEGKQSLNLDNGNYWTELPSLGFKADYHRTGGRSPDAPVAVDYPTFTRRRQSIRLPTWMTPKREDFPADIAQTVAGVEYRRTITVEGDTVTIDQSVRALKPEISFAEARAAETDLRALDQNYVGVAFRDQPDPDEKIRAALGHAPRTADDYARAADKLSDDGEAEFADVALDKAIAMAPGNADWRRRRVQWRIDEGRYAAAGDDVGALLRLDPRGVDTRRLASIYHVHTATPAAVVADAAALARDPTAEGQHQRGRILARAGRFAEAVAAYDAALKIAPKPSYYVDRFFARDPADTAARRADLDAALKLAPTDSDTLLDLSQLASALGDHAAAMGLLDRALLEDPDDLTVRSYRAVQLKLAGRGKDADREFIALAAKELTADQLNNLCWIKATANVAIDGAMADCDRALKLSDTPDEHDSRAFVLLRMNKYDEAMAEYARALKDRDVASSYYGRAIVYARKGDKAKSDADAAHALRLDPGIERRYAGYGLTR
ncbi:DUF3857 domain-containing protein [Sphingomonas sp. ASV193]|uniref:DUF3857 domain-containing protein n=1 Tax=Sphingomonas sp. ASV193 TaxID=3144405 RepID=UPI0032E8FE33